jgi:predicted secreted protein
MALRYWVGGTASWDGTAGTKWAATSGGAGGQSVPTSADDVFFDAASGVGAVTIATGNTGAKSITCTGFTGTLTGTADITVSGSITLSSGTFYVHTGTVTINATGTLTTAGRVFSALTIDGSGITVTLGDALDMSTRSITLAQGTFTTSNFNVLCGGLTSSGSLTRVLNLGSSTITNMGNLTLIGTGLTVNAGTSQFNLSSASAALTTAGTMTLHNLSFTATTAGTRTVDGSGGALTFNNLTLTASASGLSSLQVASNITVNGTLTCAGTSALQRGFVRSDTIGTTRTITAAAISANDCDFRDITLAGAAAGAAPTRAGDCGGNSGITFPAAKTVYRVGTNPSWAGSSSWAPTSNGTGADTNFPLAQDTAVIDNGTALTGTLAMAPSAYNCGALDCSSRTNAITLNYNVSMTWYGSHAWGSGVTVSGTTGQTFSGRGTMTFTSASKTTTFTITVDAPGGTFRLGDAYSASQQITLTRGTFDANNQTLTCTTFNASGGFTRSILMGSGQWTLSGTGTAWNAALTSNLTFNAGTANILLSNTTTSSRVFQGGGLSYNRLTIGGATGTSTLTISGAGTSFTELASTKTVAHTITWSANLGTIGTWSVTGAAGNVVTLNSSSGAVRRTFTLTNTSTGIDYLAVQDIGELSGFKFAVGANSTNNGNNVNVYFAATPASAGNSLFFGSNF